METQENYIEEALLFKELSACLPKDEGETFVLPESSEEKQVLYSVKLHKGDTPVLRSEVAYRTMSHLYFLDQKWALKGDNLTKLCRMFPSFLLYDIRLCCDSHTALGSCGRLETLSRTCYLLVPVEKLLASQGGHYYYNADIKADMHGIRGRSFGFEGSTQSLRLVPGSRALVAAVFMGQRVPEAAMSRFQGIGTRFSHRPDGALPAQQVVDMLQDLATKVEEFYAEQERERMA